MLHRANLLRGLGGSSTSCVVTCVGRPTVVTSSWVYARFSWPDRLVAWLSRACSFFDPRNDRLSISCLSSSSFRLRSCSYTIKSSVYLSSFIQRDSKEKKHPSYPLKISRRSIIKSNPKIISISFAFSMTLLPTWNRYLYSSLRDKFHSLTSFVVS